MHGWVSAVGAKARERSAAVRAHATKDGRAALARRTARIRLLPAVATAIVAGLGVAVAAYTVLRWITPTSKAEAAPIDITKVSLTVVAGVGGVVALVIAYRRQRDLEQSRFVERFGAAAAQLGATDVAVRIAGVYAMAGVADESDGLRRQQCIDVLCGYLRLPYSPELGGNHQSKLVLKHHRATADGTRADDAEHHLEYRHNDREVRATILRVITDHLRLTAEYSWSASDFDFRTAHLENVDLSEATFLGVARFDYTTFTGSASFSKATFADLVSFTGATFTAGAGFDRVTFSHSVSFGGATFSSGAEFTGATFSDGGWFFGATFSDGASFGFATFSGDTLFNDAKFCDATRFDRVVFAGATEFNSATFSRYTRFDRSTFSGATGFNGTTFAHHTEFTSATFSGGARFIAATFSGPASFEGVDFGTAPILFDHPRLWGPPAPVFDWSADITRKPANVTPQEWPPTGAQTTHEGRGPEEPAM